MKPSREELRRLVVGEIVGNDPEDLPDALIKLLKTMYFKGYEDGLNVGWAIEQDKDLTLNKAKL